MQSIRICDTVIRLRDNFLPGSVNHVGSIFGGIRLVLVLLCEVVFKLVLGFGFGLVLGFGFGLVFRFSCGWRRVMVRVSMRVWVNFILKGLRLRFLKLH